jgi:hypothetical protein
VARADTDTDPRQIATRAIKVSKEDKGYTHIACVLDADKSLELVASQAMIKKYKDIGFYTSYPCFEVWLLLHFLSTDAPFENCQSVEARLLSFWPNFTKGLRCPCQQTIENLGTAKKNHDLLEAKCTNIPLLLDRLSLFPQPY